MLPGNAQIHFALFIDFKKRHNDGSIVNGIRSDWCGKHDTISTVYHLTQTVAKAPFYLLLELQIVIAPLITLTVLCTCLFTIFVLKNISYRPMACRNISSRTLNLTALQSLVPTPSLPTFQCCLHKSAMSKSWERGPAWGRGYAIHTYSTMTYLSAETLNLYV